jgi:hypothetical protein
VRQRTDGAEVGQRQGARRGQPRCTVCIWLGWKASLGIYNLFKTNAHAMQFWYVDRLRSEIAMHPDRRADIYVHPL